MINYDYDYINFLEDLRKGYNECFTRLKQITNNIEGSTGHLNTLNLRCTREEESNVYANQKKLLEYLYELEEKEKVIDNELSRKIDSGETVTNEYIKNMYLYYIDFHQKVVEADDRNEYITAYIHGNIGEYQKKLLKRIDNINNKINNTIKPELSSLKDLKFDNSINKKFHNINRSINEWNRIYFDLLHDPEIFAHDKSETIYKNYTYGNQIIDYYDYFKGEIQKYLPPAPQTTPVNNQGFGQTDTYPVNPDPDAIPPKTYHRPIRTTSLYRNGNAYQCSYKI